MSLLSQINSPHDLRQLKAKQLTTLAAECRQALLDGLNDCGGHLAASLGVTELTLALHYCFNTPEDKLIWDVGHQAHIHKLLTGRKNLATLRQQNGLAPFTCREESEYDPFGSGHACTAISAATGFAAAHRHQNQSHHSIAIVGDGGLSGGLSYEALNHIGAAKLNVIVILNDNGWSISPHVGALKQTGAMGQWTEALGFYYHGPIDGHDFSQLLPLFEQLKQQKGPHFVHLKTTKGKGHKAAEQDPLAYHAVSKNFLAEKKSSSPINYSQQFGQWACKMAEQDERLVIITAAMIEGSGLSEFTQRFPGRCYDVGIAEQHAVTLAAGLAANGMKPVVAIYSTFLQRAYDQLIHDVALQNLPVVFAVDRAGLVGNDGATHMGAFDNSYLACVPNLICMTASSGEECLAMLDFAYQQPGPSVVRYPKANCPKLFSKLPIQLGCAEIIRPGEKIALLVFGSLLTEALETAKNLNATVVNMRFVKPLDKKLLQKLAESHQLLVTIEENTVIGGAGSQVSQFVALYPSNCRVLPLGLNDNFIAHASRAEQLQACELDAAGLLRQIQPHL